MMPDFLRYGFFSLVWVLTLVATSAAQIQRDLKVDPGFAPNVDGRIYSVTRAGSPDGRVYVTGEFTNVNGTPANFIARLFTDGSVDTSFHSPFSPASGMISRVEKVVVLADGRLLVGGDLKIGTQYAKYARLAIDGSLDPTFGNFQYSTSKVFPLADGKILACGGRIMGDEYYAMAHRINADGSMDLSFRATAAVGTCLDAAVLPSGKILLAGPWMQTWDGPDLDRVYRVNADGIKDDTFHFQPPTQHVVDKILPMPDGTFYAVQRAYTAPLNSTIIHYTADGAQMNDQVIDCGYYGPQTDMAIRSLGNNRFAVTGCRRWSGGPTYDFTTVANGKIERGNDQITSNQKITAIETGVSGDYFVSGQFTNIGGTARSGIARLIPVHKKIRNKTDFDGDGKSDLAVFRPGERYWYINRSTEGYYFLQFGLDTDVLVPGQFDTDARADVNVYRPSSGVWYSMLSPTAFNYIAFGGDAAATSTRAFIGDFDAADSDFAVCSTTATGVTWRTAMHNGWYATDPFSIPGQTATDTPLIADFDGDSNDELCYFRAGDWTCRSADAGSPPVTTYHWGTAGDIPVAADYDGDGTTDYAVFRPSTGTWWVDRSTHGLYAVQFGQNGDIPVQADYDADGKTDIAVYRNGIWWQFLSATGTAAAHSWGLATDKPIQAQ